MLAPPARAGEGAFGPTAVAGVAARHLCVDPARDRVMKAGDFEVVRRGSVHAVQSTREGCVLLICSSLSDELLPG